MEVTEIHVMMLHHTFNYHIPALYLKETVHICFKVFTTFKGKYGSHHFMTPGVNSKTVAHGEFEDRCGTFCD